jgi:hypothetical protein
MVTFQKGCVSERQRSSRTACLPAGKNRPRQCRNVRRRVSATTDEVKGLRREAGALKEVVAEQAVELRLLKKSMIGDGGDPE